ncbi:hypothetical protein AKJ61_01305 [candidate division MSBL1 archaeon SCGC-AAA259B11]|uniref:Uncharacterized protein n=1 Tax=candidate division MSBL1 archaeon SCGC-AAA259B11 TaxID=1698260 RepID=A0A133U7K5_9EURY|nr:hypothetical protein AKJ61_01305 [candidate division MSBL1 archaeon SCGC-AAA259B11]
MVSALAHHEYGGSVEDISELLGVGKGALNEARTCLSDLKYSRTGPAEVIEYDGLKIGIVTQDMIYKGREGVMLGVSGGLQMTEIGNEKTCEGLNTYFDELEEKLDVDKLLVLMDMNTTVAKKLLELFQEKVIIVLQNHSNWGDVYVYFYRGGWRTLRLRTDAFTEPSFSRDFLERSPAVARVWVVRLFRSEKFKIFLRRSFKFLNFLLKCCIFQDCPNILSSEKTLNFEKQATGRRNISTPLPRMLLVTSVGKNSLSALSFLHALFLNHSLESFFYIFSRR